MLYRIGKNVPCLVEIIAGIKQTIDLLAVTRPFLDLVEVARIGDQRIVGFFVGPRRSFHHGIDAIQRQHKAKRVADFEQVLLAIRCFSASR